MANPLEPYLPQPTQPPLMTGMERLLAPKPAPQGDLRNWDSQVANAGAYLEDNAGMRDLGKVVQAAGLGSIEGIRPDQLVRAGTDVAMLAPQVGTTARAVSTAAKALPVFYQGVKQAALPAVAKVAPALGNAGVESTYLASALTGDEQLGDVANMARAGQRGLRTLTARRDLDVGRQSVGDKTQFGNERDQLAAAIRLARQGHDMEAIRQQTGWRTLPGKEGSKPQWAYEISDDQARISEKNLSGHLGNQLSHPTLYDYYPEAAFIERNPNPNLGEARGKLNLGGGRYGTMEYNPIHPNMTHEPQMRGNVLHELQHWIQKREGWEGGGSPNMDSVRDAADAKMSDLFASGHLNENTPVSDLVKTHDNLRREAYWNLAGEAHARSTANRMFLNPQQRKATNPYEVGYVGYDRTPDELIYQN